MAKTIENESSPVNIITAGTKIKGDIILVKYHTII